MPSLGQANDKQLYFSKGEAQESQFCADFPGVFLETS